MEKTIEFTWLGINQFGRKISGQMLAKNKEQVHEKLCVEKITTLIIHKKQSWHTLFRSRVFSDKQRLDFTQQLQLLLQSGITLVDALSLMTEHTDKTQAREMIMAIKEKIISGKTLANTLRDYPQAFDQAYAEMIGIGEQSGQLEFVLSQLIETLEQQIAMKNKAAKMLFYPVTVLCITILISMGLLIFVIPQFNNIYQSFGAQLPALTLTLIHLSQLITHHVIFIICCFILFIILIRHCFKKNNILKISMGNLLLRVPPLRSLYMTKQITQWGQLMSMLLSSGIPMIETLQIANRIMTHPCIQQQMGIVQNHVMAGEPLHIALNHCPYFPKRAKYLISIGENADALDVMMKRLCTIYRREYENTLDHLSKLLEPVIMIGVAGFISGLIIAMYLPIFHMGNVIQ